jgi:hypothetical protein
MPEHRTFGVEITSQLDAAVPERHANAGDSPRVDVGTVRAPHAFVTTGSMRNSMSFLVLVGTAMLCACNEASPDERSTEFVVTISNLTPAESLFATGRFDMPDTEVLAGPLEPGESYRFDVVVWPGAQLQIVTMFVESNDAFLAFAPGGIALWTPDGEPLVGNRSAELVLYDAGTELNEPLGTGSSQAPRQLEPGAGEPEGGPVTVITDGESGAAVGPGGVEFPAIAEFVELQIMHIDGPNFRVVIRNVSTDDLLDKLSGGPQQEDMPARLSPGVFTVHAAGVELFDVGEPATPQLERLVEDADPAPLAEQLEFMQGVASDLSAVVWAVDDGDGGLFAMGSGASAGLEDLVEDDRPELLLEQLGEESEFEQWGLVEGEASVIEPGATVEIRFMAEPGDHFSFVTGYLAANDKFIGAAQMGIPLFDENGAPRIGELDWAIGLFDAGTEIDETPGLGPNQFERQPMRGAGLDEGELVREIHGEWNGWEYPSADQIVDVTIDVIPKSKINSGS